MEFMIPLALATDLPTWLVCVLGISVVFVGLICIIAILYLMNFLISKGEGAKTEKATAPVTPVAPASVPVAAPIENRREIVAAVCAAVAAEEGTDISAIRVISFKKL